MRTSDLMADKHPMIDIAGDTSHPIQVEVTRTPAGRHVVYVHCGGKTIVRLTCDGAVEVTDRATRVPSCLVDTAHPTTMPTIPPTSRADVLKRLTEILLNQLNADASHVTETASLGDDLGADSLDSIEIIMAVEEEFSITIPEADVDRLKTVGEITDYITSKAVGEKS